MKKTENNDLEKSIKDSPFIRDINYKYRKLFLQSTDSKELSLLVTILTALSHYSQHLTELEMKYNRGVEQNQQLHASN